MKTLWKCCIRSLKENKARTIVTILGVAMATVLITTLACIGTSILATAIQFLKSTSGTAHETYVGVERENLKYFLNNQSIEEIWLKKKMDRYYIDFKDSYLNSYVVRLVGASDGWFSAQGLKMVEGRLPEHENEIILHKGVRTGLGYDINIGDRIAARSEDSDKAFEVVGFYENNYLGFDLIYDLYYYQLESILEGDSPENYQSYRVIEAYTYWDGNQSGEGEYDVSLRYKKSALYQRDEIAAGLMGISQTLYERVYKNPYAQYTRFSDAEKKELTQRVKKFNPNSTLEAFEALSPFHLTQATVWIIAFSEVIFLFFVLAGVFCINNSFDISITERIRFYGMISSVGSSKRQRRMLVWMEAFVIGLFGIPLGIMLGIVLSFGIVKVANIAIKALMPAFEMKFVFRIATWAILIAVFQAIFMIALSAMEAAFRAAKITPMEAIRSNDTIKSKGKKKKTPKILRKVLGVGGIVAWQNFKRSKVKYRATIVSIAVSIAFVLGMCFVPFGFRYLESDLQVELGGMDYQVEVDIDHASGYDKLIELKNSDEVTVGRIKRRGVGVYDEKTTEDGITYSANVAFILYAWDDESFEEICKKNGIDSQKASGKGLVLKNDNYYEVGKTYTGEYNIYKLLKKGQEGIPVSIEIAGEIDKETVWDYPSSRDIYVSESFVKAHPDLFGGAATGYFKCKDANAFTKAVKDENIVGMTMTNYDLIYQVTKLVKIIVYMFMIGFLFLVIAIGTTNVINAINSNMEMRASEFAKLRAVGMTRKQFRGMIFAEGIFIAIKGLFWGYLFGCGIYYILHKLFVESSDMLFADPYYRVLLEFHLPIGQMLVGAAVVVLLLYLVLNAHVKKVEKRNIIETIRNENI
ncbi:MAG: ABC transporter permease [Lachnospiraceae bacterium]|nr:ABC transporter permease [Lachnospiraceae bacterium]